jgi:hypothetical protein
VRLTEPGAPILFPTPADRARGYGLLALDADNKPPSKKIICKRVEELLEDNRFLHDGSVDANVRFHFYHIVI